MQMFEDQVRNGACNIITSAEILRNEVTNCIGIGSGYMHHEIISTTEEIHVHNAGKFCDFFCETADM